VPHDPPVYSQDNAPTLANTVADAVGLARLFRTAGFETVILRNDLGVMDFRRAVRDFLVTAEGADIAVVYYAGHGIEIGGMNYLVPVDAKLSRDYDVDDEAVSLDRIVWVLQSVKRLRLILLDACRDNPLPGAVHLRIVGRVHHHNRTAARAICRGKNRTAAGTSTAGGSKCEGDASRVTGAVAAAGRSRGPIAGMHQGRATSGTAACGA
jgi:hypothetical protein